MSVCSLLPINTLYSMDASYFIYSSVGSHLYASTSGLSLIMYKFLSNHVFSSLDVYLWVGCKMVTISSTFWRQKFPPTQIIRLNFSHPYEHCCHLSFILGILVGWSNISLWFLVCISLMVNDVKHFFMGLWAFVYIFWWKCLLKSLAHL